MDIVQAKFDNFKKFVAEAAPGAMLLQRFLAMDLREFLSTVNEKMKENLTTDEIVGRVLDFAWMSRDSFTPDQIAKLKLYIEYFCDITQRLRARCGNC